MKIVIEGDPISKNRTKCMCMGNKPRVYDPQVDVEMKIVKAQILSEWNKIWDCVDNKKMVLEASYLTKVKSFSVGFTFLFPTNKSEALGQKNAKLWGFVPHIVKPDFDNLEKFYSDCATGILWDDDCQITVAYSKKLYSEYPRTEIEIMANNPLKLHPKAQEILKVFGPSKMSEFCKDIQKFWSWSPKDIYDLIPEGESRYKEEVLTAICCTLAEFADKYADDLKKILKHKELAKDILERDAMLHAIDKGDLNV